MSKGPGPAVHDKNFPFLEFNLLDWNHNETSSSLLIGLNNSAFIVDKTISKNLLPICLQAEEGCFASVRWIERGLKFALGTDKGMIQVKKKRT